MNYFKDEILRVCVLIAMLAFWVMIFCVMKASADEIDTIMPYLIQAESGGDPNAVSKAGAIGICQVTPIVLDEFNQMNVFGVSGEKIHYDNGYGICVDYVTLEGLKDPRINIALSRWYLRRLRNTYKCDTLEKVLAGYNCGPTKLKSVGYDINKCPAETRAYVKKIMKGYKSASK